MGWLLSISRRLGLIAISVNRLLIGRWVGCYGMVAEDWSLGRSVGRCGLVTMGQLLWVKFFYRLFDMGWSL